MTNLSLNETREAIIEYQKAGRPKALRNIIALQNKNLIYSALKEKGYYNIDHRDIEELEQEAFICLLEAIDLYSPNRGAFSSFFYLYIHKVLRKSIEYKDISIDESVKNGIDDNITIADTLEDEEGRKDFEQLEHEEFNKNIREEIKNTLERDIVDMLFSYYGIARNKITQQELCKRYNLSASVVSERIKKAKMKIKRNLKIQRLWIEYKGYDSLRTSSILKYSSKTNLISNPVLEDILRRHDQINLLKRESLILI